MLVEGKYKGIPTNWGFVETKTGAIMASIEFQILNETVSWNGRIEASQEGKRNYTHETLRALGFGRGNTWADWSEEDFAAFESGTGPLSKTAPIDVTVQHYEAGGKKFASVQYINPSRFVKIGVQRFKEITGTASDVEIPF